MLEDGPSRWSMLRRAPGYRAQTRPRTIAELATRSHFMRHLILENFMPFSGRRTIPIAPLTLIFGPNNAGKSAIIRALLMLKQTATEGDENSPLLSAGQPEDSVDLGKFADYVFRHDTSLPVTVGLTTRVHRSPESVLRMSSLMDERPNLVDESGLPFADIGMAAVVSNGHDGETELDRVEFFFNDPRDPAFTLFAMKDLKRDFDLESEIVGHLHLEARDDYLRTFASSETLMKLLKLFQTEEYRSVFASSFSLLTSVLLQIGNQKDSTNSLMETISINHVSEVFPMTELVRGVVNYQSAIWRSLVATNIDNIMSAGWDEHPDSVHQEVSEAIAAAVSSTYRLRRFSIEYGTGDHYEFYDSLIDFSPIFSFPIFASDKVKEDLAAIRHIAPLRERHSRDTIINRRRDLDQGARGQNLEWVLKRSPSLRKEINKTLAHLKIGFEVYVDSDASRGKVGGIRLREVLDDWETREPIDVSIVDVGSGIGQVLPIVLECLNPDRRILLIEQPELHLHPAVQSELGDLFIKAALGNRDQHALDSNDAETVDEPVAKDNNVIIETHSEHLILRIMRRIRETTAGTLPEGIPPIYPEDVSVLYVEPTEDGSMIRPIDLDSQGRWIGRWPNGFFEEGYRERTAGMDTP